MLDKIMQFLKKTLVISILFLVVSVCGITLNTAVADDDATYRTEIGNSLLISNTSQRNYEWFSLALSTRLFVDRSFIYEEIPSELIGFNVLRTANNDKARRNDSFLSFNVNVPVNVYVVYDTRLALPDWLSDWENTGLMIKDSDSGTSSRELYRKDFGVGRITLGGNEGRPRSSMYTVIVRAIEVSTRPKVSDVSMNPSGGSFEERVSVNLNATTVNAKIYYTRDGSTPTSSSSLYTGVFELSRTATIKSVAILENYVDSNIVSADFVIGQPNSTPIAVPDNASTDMDTAININVLENDLGLDDGPITVSIIKDPGVGDLSVEDDNTIEFVPDGVSEGEFTVIYQIKDSDGEVGTASLNLTIMCGFCADNVNLELSWNENSAEENVEGYVATYRKNKDAIKTLPFISIDDSGFDAANPLVELNAGTDLGLIIGDDVCFTVAARNAAGMSNASGEVCIAIAVK